MSLDKLLVTLQKGDTIKEGEIKDLTAKARDIFASEENLQRVSSPASIVGDIHGQFYDLLELLLIAGEPPQTNYIFLGDFVDRGLHSIETFLLLLVLKCKYPGRVTMCRGNHESRQITQVYGFYDECLRKYGSVNVWRYCTEVFDNIPIAALIDGKIFCVHAGLSPSIATLDQIKTIERKGEVPHEGPMCDLLWSDPSLEADGWAVSERGAGYFFGADVVRQFILANNLDLICRSHQLVMEGYKHMFPGHPLVTIWSAPNYCYRCGNVACVLEVDENLKQNYKLYEAAPDSAKGVTTSGGGADLKALPDYFL